MSFTTKLDVPRNEQIDFMIEDAKSRIENTKTDSPWNQLTLSLAVKKWKANRRPFVHVWPTIEKALLRTNLNIDPAMIPRSIVHQLEAVEVRCSDCSSLKPFMLSITEHRDFGSVYGRAVAVSRSWQHTDHQGLGWMTSGVLLPYGEMASENNYWHSKDELKIAVGILMLAVDPKYCTPMLLNRDKSKNLTGAKLSNAIDRAKRNGKHGFDIGSSIEASPHYRRPHFAIRWTGKGGKIPRLVPVKGSVVNQTKITVPTGYDG